MIEYLIWGLSFVTLYFTIVLISILYLDEDKDDLTKESKDLSITIAIPAYNESDNIRQTITSALDIDYPKDKIRFVVINDGSKDNTLKVINETVSKYKGANIKVIDQTNKGKAEALNSALINCKTELFACLDADSIVDKEVLKPIMPHFSDENTAAVVTAIRIYEPKTSYEHIQRIEYIVTILARRIMSLLNTLHVTPGVLSVYRTEVLKKLGGFDKDNITEDFEIALRLKSKGYDVQLEPKAITFTKAPKDFGSLWKQRIRWYRGFIQNYYKYRHLFFNPKFGFLGYFQIPINVLGVFILLMSLGLSVYAMISNAIETTIRSVTIKGYLATLFYVPTFKEFVLGQNFKIMFPIFIASVLGLYMFYLAHKYTREKFLYPLSIWLYLFIFPFITCAHWIAAIFHELFGTKRRWGK